MPFCPATEEETVLYDFNQQVIDEFRANHGRVGGMFERARLVLLTTTGARTGEQHTVPLGYLPDDGGRMLVIASAGGAPTNPAWYHNARAHPRVTVETGIFTIEADAEVLTGEERDRLFARAVALNPGWGEYQEKAGRTIPVVALRPVSGTFPHLPEGDVLVILHDAYRRELALVRDEIAASGAGIGAQLRINCLTLCGGLHHHHGAESGELFPYLREHRPELSEVLDRLDEQHETLAALLDELQLLISADGTDPTKLLAEIDRLITEIEAHLTYEESQLVPVLNALPPRDVGPGRWVDTSGRSATDAGVTVYVHGGGFEHSAPEHEDALARVLSTATDRPVFVVAQRLAPDHPYPAALDDVLDVYRSLLDSQVPASRVVLFGESSGATLVLSALLTLVASGSPLPAGAVVVSPLTDLTLRSPSLDADVDDTISRQVLEHVRDQYLAGAEPDQAPQSPMHGELAGLPPLLVAAGADEVLLDDARRLAAAATTAGVHVDLDVYGGMTHGFHLAVLAAEPPPEAVTFLDRLSDWTKQRAG